MIRLLAVLLALSAPFTGAAILPQPPQQHPMMGPETSLKTSGPGSISSPKISPNDGNVQCPGAPWGNRLRYGNCYRMLTTDGVELGTRSTDGWYRFQDPNKNIRFRVCHTRDNCEKSSDHLAVPSGGTWYLYDTRGTVQSGGPGWVGNWDYWLAPIPKTFHEQFISKFTGTIECGTEHGCEVCMRMTDHYGNWNGIKVDPNTALVVTQNAKDCITVLFRNAECPT